MDIAYACVFIVGTIKHTWYCFKNNVLQWYHPLLWLKTIMIVVFVVVYETTLTFPMITICIYLLFELNKNVLFLSKQRRLSCGCARVNTLSFTTCSIGWHVITLPFTMIITMITQIL